jgi:glutathione S-transferase
MIQLYEFALSGNSHKIRVMLGYMGLKYESHALNGAAREHKQPEFLALNPFGQVPLLVDGDVVIRDSQAILVYLARAYGDGSWFPVDAAQAAAVAAWLSTAANEVSRGPGDLRAHRLMGRSINVDQAEAVTTALLAIIENRLANHQWLALDLPTIADVAVYPYLALSHQGGVSLDSYPHTERWLRRMEGLPGYVSMPGIGP